MSCPDDDCAKRAIDDLAERMTLDDDVQAHISQVARLFTGAPDADDGEVSRCD